MKILPLIALLLLVQTRETGFLEPVPLSPPTVSLATCSATVTPGVKIGWCINTTGVKAMMLKWSMSVDGEIEAIHPACSGEVPTVCFAIIPAASRVLFRDAKPPHIVVISYVDPARDQGFNLASFSVPQSSCAVMLFEYSRIFLTLECTPRGNGV